VLAAPAHSPAIVSVPPGRYRGGGVLAGMAPGSRRPAAGGGCCGAAVTMTGPAARSHPLAVCSARHAGAGTAGSGVRASASCDIQGASRRAYRASSAISAVVTGGEVITGAQGGEPAPVPAAVRWVCSRSRPAAR
jgi:hypothetical protein